MDPGAIAARPPRAPAAPARARARRFVAYAWFTSILLVLASFFAAAVVADRHRGKGTGGLGFAAVWTTILCLFISVGGTVVMRKFQTGFAIGIFLGVVTVMANQCLMMVAIFGQWSGNEDEDKESKKAADDTFTTFSFFLFVVYAFFASLLAVFRASFGARFGPRPRVRRRAPQETTSSRRTPSRRRTSTCPCPPATRRRPRPSSRSRRSRRRTKTEDARGSPAARRPLPPLQILHPEVFDFCFVLCSSPNNLSAGVWSRSRVLGPRDSSVRAPKVGESTSGGGVTEIDRASSAPCPGLSPPPGHFFGIRA